MFDILCSGNQTNAPNQLHAGLVLLSDVQPLHNALVGEVHFLPFSQLFSELFRLMSSDTYSWCSVCHLCVFRAFYSKIPQHLEGRRAGNKTGNLCFVGFIDIKNPKLLAFGILDASYILIIIKLCYILTKRNPTLSKSLSSSVMENLLNNYHCGNLVGFPFLSLFFFFFLCYTSL